jgi:uncharacterized protein
MADDGLPARVFLRPIGTPLPIGIAGLGIASLVESGLELHWVSRSQGTDVGLILIAVPFALQLLACVFSYLARDGAAGSCMGILATTWLGLGLIHVVSRPGAVSGALGLMLLASAGLLFVSAISVATAKLLPAVVFTIAALRFVLAGIYQLSAVAGWQDAGGITGLVVTAFAAYSALAFELEGVNRRPILPTFRLGPGRAAIADGPAAQVEHVEHEAGVRQTS